MKLNDLPDSVEETEEKKSKIFWTFLLTTNFDE